MLFSSTGRDDAYITYWAARSLARTGEITNYNGARVEQSSSLLHMLILAAANRLTTVSIPALGMWIGIIAAAITVVVAARLAERIAPGAGITAALLTAVAPFLVYWAFGGLEAPLVSLLLTAVAATAGAVITAPTRRAVTALVLSAVGFLMVRPEAGAVLACAGAAALILAFTPWWRRAHADDVAPQWRGAALVLAAAVVISLLLLGWREWYFGAAVSQTVSAKVSGIHLHEGFDYVRLWWGHWWMVPALVAAAAGIAVAARRRDWHSTMVVLLLVSYGGFVVFSGGDWMEAGRFLVPIAPLVAILAAVAVRQIPQPILRAGTAAVVILTQVLGLGWVASRWSTGRPVWTHLTAALPAADLAAARAAPWFERDNRVHFRDDAFLRHLGQVVDTVATRVSGKVTIASGQAGMVPYYLMQTRQDRVLFIDRSGLTSNPFHRCAHALIRSTLGAAMTLDYWLAHTQECGVPAPDVVYDVGTFAAQAALQQNYELVYQQPDVPITTESRHLHGVATSAAEFIAVRSDLWPSSTP